MQEPHSQTIDHIVNHMKTSSYLATLFCIVDLCPFPISYNLENRINNNIKLRFLMQTTYILKKSKTVTENKHLSLSEIP